MAEVVTTTAAAVGVVSFLGKDLVQKVLGPSSDYLGEQLKLFTQKNVENLKSIFEKAEEKLPEQTENQGSVPPQIIRDVLFDGSFCEDEISQEYYAGILASSKTQNALDNRGKTITSIIRNLSTYQLTAHYILYGTIWVKARGTRNNPNYFNSDQFLELFNFPTHILDETEKDKAQALLDHVFSGLEKYDLVKSLDEMNYDSRYSPNTGITGGWYCGQYWYKPTLAGIELFLWATGNGNRPIDYFYSEKCEIYDLPDIDFNDFI